MGSPRRTAYRISVTGPGEVRLELPLPAQAGFGRVTRRVPIEITATGEPCCNCCRDWLAVPWYSSMTLPGW